MKSIHAIAIACVLMSSPSLAQNDQLKVDGASTNSGTGASRSRQEDRDQSKIGKNGAANNPETANSKSNAPSTPTHSGIATGGGVDANSSTTNNR